MTKYIVVVGAWVLGFAFAWVPLSVFLAIHLASAEDNVDPNGPAPVLLKSACKAIFFPMRNIQGWDDPGNKGALYVTVGMALNGVFWAIFSIVFLGIIVEAATRLRRRNHRRGHYHRCAHDFGNHR